LPYFIRDNTQFVKTKFDVDVYTPEERKFTRAHKTQESMRRVRDYLSKSYPEIPNTELAAIHHYTKTGGNYRQLNKQMENGMLTDFNRASKTLIAQGLEKLPIYEGDTYRGVIIKRNEFERIFGNVGSTVKQNRFISTSIDYNVAFDFAARNQEKMKKSDIQVIFEIKSKNGRNIAEISEFNGIFVPKNQQEVLFTNNTTFRIDGKTYTGNVVWVKMTEI